MAGVQDDESEGTLRRIDMKVDEFVECKKKIAVEAELAKLKEELRLSGLRGDSLDGIVERLAFELAKAQKEIKSLRIGLERISQFDSHSGEWPQEIYINAPPEELADFILKGIDYPPETADEKGGTE
jgi:hypothetical protein